MQALSRSRSARITEAGEPTGTLERGNRPKGCSVQVRFRWTSSMTLEPNVVPTPRQHEGGIVYRVLYLFGRQIDLTSDRGLATCLNAGAAGGLQRVQKLLGIHGVEVALLARHPSGTSGRLAPVCGEA